jgi:hypothetical protein
MGTSTKKVENAYIAKILNEVADLLQQQNTSSFRIGAWAISAMQASPVR